MGMDGDGCGGCGWYRVVEQCVGAGGEGGERCVDGLMEGLKDHAYPL